MAEVVRQTLESISPELYELKNREIFTGEEVNKIIKDVTKFEYALLKRPPHKKDFLRYIQYQVNLDAIRRVRRRKKPNVGKIRHSEHGLSKRIHHTFQGALKKFSGDLKLWKEYISFCQRTGSAKTLDRVVAQAIQYHPLETDLWILAAKHQFEEYANIQAARTMLQRGLRTQDTNLALWREYTRLEYLYWEKMLKRRNILAGRFPEDTSVHADFQDEGEEMQFWRGEVILLLVRRASTALKGQFLYSYLTQVLDFIANSRLGAPIHNTVREDLRVTLAKLAEDVDTESSAQEKERKSLLAIAQILLAWPLSHARVAWADETEHADLEGIAREIENSQVEVMECLGEHAGPCGDELIITRIGVWNEFLAMVPLAGDPLVGVVQEALIALQEQKSSSEPSTDEESNGDIASEVGLAWMDAIDEPDVVDLSTVGKNNEADTVDISDKKKWNRLRSETLIGLLFKGHRAALRKEIQDTLQARYLSRALMYMMRDILSCMFPNDVSLHRHLYECAVDNFGRTDHVFWAEYMQFEVEKGDRTRYDGLYTRAIKMLKNPYALMGHSVQQ
eukprot:Clim_evm20s12 gene=Clim_evmTU20s12